MSLASSRPRDAISEFLKWQSGGASPIKELTMQVIVKQVKSKSNVFTGKDEEFTIKHK